MVSRMPHPTAPGDLPVHVRAQPTRARPTLVLLHGLTDSGECWPDAVTTVARPPTGSRRRTPAATAPHPASPLSSSPPDPIEAMYRDAVEVVSRVVATARAAHRWCWSGTPWAAASRRAVAARHPDLVARGVLEDPAWLERGVRGPTGTRAPSSAWRRCQDVPGRRPETAMAMGTAENAGWPEAELGPWVRAKAAATSASSRPAWPSCDTPWTAIAAAIGVPTLVVTGDARVILGPQVRARAVEALGNDQIEVARRRRRRPLRRAATSPRPSTPSSTRGWPRTPADVPVPSLAQRTDVPQQRVRAGRAGPSAR